MTQETTLADYHLCPAVRTWPLDVTGPAPRYLVEVGEERRFEVTAGVHQIVESLRTGPQTVDSLVAALHRQGNTTVTPERVLWLLDKVLLARGIVQPLEGVPAEDVETYSGKTKRVGYLKAKVPLLSAQLLRPVTQALRPLFRPPVMAVLLAAATLAHIFFYTTLFHTVEWAVLEIPLPHYLLLLLLLNATAVFHELGHATACRYYDCPHGKIGWAIYLFMPVLYADVSQAWRLTRGRRAVVDCGGMYFELIATLAALGLYLGTRHPVFFYLFVFLNISIFSSLNPVLRRDGYWLVSDLIGQSNLRDANLEVLRYVLHRVLRRPVGERPELFDKPFWLRWTLYLYSVGTVIFSCYLTFWVARHMVSELVFGVPRLLGKIAAGLQATPMDLLGAASAALRLGFFLIFVFLIGSIAWGLVSSLLRTLTSAKSEDPGTRAVFKEETT